MKRVLIAALLTIVIALLSSCSSYTCPTYAKQAPQKPVAVNY